MSELRLVLDVDQRSDEWRAARCGLYTGSLAGAIFSGWSVKEGRKKGEPSVQRRDACYLLATERITGIPQDDDDLSSRVPWMRRGVEQEDAAKDAYELATNRVIRSVGFVRRTDLQIGCSPDGLVGGDDEGGVELKNPKTATHIGYLLAAKNPYWFPDDYVPQLRHNLLVTGRAWWDFVSYDGRMPPPLRMVRRRLTREQARLEDYQRDVEVFLAEVAALEQSLLAMAESVEVVA